MRVNVVSLHAFENHLDASNLCASVFLNRFSMFQSVKNCLNDDVINQKRHCAIYVTSRH